MTVPDILKKVLAGLDVSCELQGTFQPRDYCVQYRETDFAFASRLMEEEGIFYFFKHTADGHKMVVANTPQSHPDVPGPAKRHLREHGQAATGPRTAIDVGEDPGDALGQGHPLGPLLRAARHKHLEAEKAIAGRRRRPAR